jgi:hypothetical protein
MKIKIQRTQVERINKLEGRRNYIKFSTKKEKDGNCKRNVKSQRGRVKRTNIHLIGVPETHERDIVSVIICKQKTVDNVPEPKTANQERQSYLKQDKQKAPLQHITVKL